MHKFVYFNRKIVSTERVHLSALSSAALYGKGVFTTIAIHRSIAFLWEKHWRRLTADARKIEIDLTAFSESFTLNSLNAVVEKNKAESGRARLTFFDESPGSIWQFDAKRRTSLLIQTADFRPVPEAFRLTVSPYRINSTAPLVGVKSCNYLENILAFNEARSRGFDEAVRLNEKDEIASACMANVFWRKGKTIYTPSLETGSLNGTTRQFILENFAVKEIAANISELSAAEGIFLTSSGIGSVECTFENFKS
jgi:branched-subunit amino acid aminotransferase/4-amino-4-deoxychorismate lyase